MHGGRGSLHRRLFVWLAAAMLAAGLFAGGFAFVMSRGSRAWFDPHEAARWAGDRFAERWDDAAARDALARETAERLHLGVRVADARGGVVTSAGAPVDERHAFHVPVVRDGARLGTLTLGFPHDPRAPVRVACGIGVFFFVLWASSGAIARRLTRPLAAAAAVADTIGEAGPTERLSVHPKSPREVKAFAGAMNRMADRVESALESQRRLLAQVSHEVRTPLGHMRILVESANEGIGLDRVFGELEREIAAIDELVGELLAGERLMVHGVKPSSVDAVELAERALRRAGGDPSALVAPERPIAIEADAALLDRALGNLLRNARDHGGGITRLEVTRGREAVRFVVSDAGPGIAADAWPRLVEGRGDAPKGLGLGLPLARRIAEAHGGALTLERTGRGARIELAIPVGPAGDAGDRETATP